ncbi:hypothetical protein [Lysobacter antibioticus]|uniref:hypothetical protein n=1 Tax=Lysobacter antibioticus TaxID=84531 RepID=UPI0007164AD6|nr:hypothetical protein [Lysobacter antibioticus]
MTGNPKMVGNPTPSNVQPGAPQLELLAMRDETVRALDDSGLDHVVRYLVAHVPGLQHTLAVAMRERRRRLRVARHLAEKAAQEATCA